MDSNDGLLTSGAVARRLGTSVPRVLRAARRGEVATVRRGNRFLFDAGAVELLRRRWGAVPSIPGLSREDVLVLAALGRRPLGLRSARAVARAAGVSPTAAGRALRRLAERGYVTRETARVVEAEVRDVPIWSVRWTGPAWLGVAATIGQATLPAEREPGRHRTASRRVPSRLAHLLWNEDLAAVDLERDAALLADRILRSEDPEAHVWMMRELPASAILQATRTRNLDPRRASLGRVLVAALQQRGRLAVEQFDAEPGRQTLNAYLDRTKLQFLEASSLHLIEPLVPVAGLQVAGLGDLLAMKLKVIRDRGELRDYYDLLVIERQGRRAEEGIALALRKYRPRAPGAFVESVVRGLSSLDDVHDDPAVPLSKAEVAAYWRSRVPEIARSLSRLG